MLSLCVVTTKIKNGQTLFLYIVTFNQRVLNQKRCISILKRKYVDVSLNDDGKYFCKIRECLFLISNK